MNTILTCSTSLFDLKKLYGFTDNKCIIFLIVGSTLSISTVELRLKFASDELKPRSNYYYFPFISTVTSGVLLFFIYNLFPNSLFTRRRLDSEIVFYLVFILRQDTERKHFLLNFEIKGLFYVHCISFSFYKTSQFVCLALLSL